LIKLIDRLDLDRPLMLREKLDILWSESKSDEESKHETMNLSVELTKKKKERMALNNKQRDIYNKLLGFLE